MKVIVIGGGWAGCAIQYNTLQNKHKRNKGFQLALFLFLFSLLIFAIILFISSLES